MDVDSLGIHVAKFSWVEISHGEMKLRQNGEMQIIQLSRGTLISSPSCQIPPPPNFPSLTLPSDLSLDLALLSLILLQEPKPLLHFPAAFSIFNPNKK